MCFVAAEHARVFNSDHLRAGRIRGDHSAALSDVPYQPRNIFFGGLDGALHITIVPKRHTAALFVCKRYLDVVVSYHGQCIETNFRLVVIYVTRGEERDFRNWFAPDILPV